MTNAILRLTGAALLLCGFAAAALAQPAPPKADAGTGAQSACIVENDGYKRSGQQPMFAIELSNKCEQRIKCRVFVYITSAKGPSQGRGTIVLAPISHGAAAKGSYVMKTKMIGGSSQSARECQAF
ncbi:MAG TPA: hypothetical protein VGF53_09380 [Pseudolabrys sp.]|jgi:hypothetical protein